ncbi:MAG: hypothetical protein ABFD07_14355 [Methanobacterium sp.]
MKNLSKMDRMVMQALGRALRKSKAEIRKEKIERLLNKKESH